MYELKCDLCGKPIKDGEAWSRYKMKRLHFSFHESWWERIEVHNACLEYLYRKLESKEVNKDEIT